MSVSQPYFEIQKYERVFSLHTNKIDTHMFLGDIRFRFLFLAPGPESWVFPNFFLKNGDIF